MLRCLVKRDKFVVEPNETSIVGVPFATHFVTGLVASDTEARQHEQVLAEQLASDFALLGGDDADATATVTQSTSLATAAAAAATKPVRGGASGVAGLCCDSPVSTSVAQQQQMSWQATRSEQTPPFDVKVSGKSAPLIATTTTTKAQTKLDNCKAVLMDIEG